MKKLLGSRFWLIFLLLFVFAINFFASVFHTRADLTQEKRYTLSETSKDLFRGLQEVVAIDVLVDGNGLPSEVRRLKNSIQEFLSNCQEYSRGHLKFHFINPYVGLNDSLQKRLEDSLYANFGLYPSVIDAPEKVGDGVRR